MEAPQQRLRSQTERRLKISLALVCLLRPLHAEAEEAPSEAAAAASSSQEIPGDAPEVASAAILPVVPPIATKATVPALTRSQEDAEGGLVVLRLTISTEGRVVEASVDQSLSAKIDEQVRQAALGFEFTPATRGESPISVAVLFPYEVPALEAPQERVPQADLAARPSAPQATPEVNVGEAPEPERQVTVQGFSEVTELRRSAYAVEVIDLTESQREAGDLGDALTRSNAVTVRRSGGLGSTARFSMGGMGGERVRFFLDGVPLKFAGFPYGPTYVPVNLVDRIEMYQGVVPIRFGTDALGGVVAFVSDQNTRTSKAQLSYEVGSFNTHRLASSGQLALPDSKSFVRLGGHLDSSDNDYPVDVLVADSQGQLVPQNLRRFHDAYRSYGLTLSGGITERKWADRLVATAFATGVSKEIQNDPTMNVPYGEVTFGKRSLGGNLRWIFTLNEKLNVEVIGGYSFVETRFQDLSSCRYSWTGDCLIDLSPIRGEVMQIPADRNIDDHAFFARTQLEWVPHHAHTLRLALAPDFALRSGDDAERSGDEYDPLNDPQSVFSSILGAEWEANVLRERLTNVLFTKLYAQSAQGEQEIATGELEKLSEESIRFGAGDSLRYFLSDTFYLKSSYELATRLPDAEEFFGDGGLIIRNLELTPERSHNVNVGVFADSTVTIIGSFHGSVAGLARFTDELIILLSSGNFLQYENIAQTRGFGTELQFGWTSPRDIAALGLNANYLDLRNQTSEGQLATFHGDRIPNQPYLRGGAELRLRARHIAQANDFADLTFRSDYVHEFFRSWESAGVPENKLVIPSQFTHDIVLSYVTSGLGKKLTGSLEAHNITNAKVYDFYGVERPGRSFHFKFTFDI